MAQATSKNESGIGLGNHLHRGLREGALYLTAALAAYLLISLATYHPTDPGWSHSGGEGPVANWGGQAGAWFADIFLYLFGYMAFLFPIMVGYAGWLLFRGRNDDDVQATPLQLGFRGLGFVVTLASGAGLAFLHFQFDPASVPLTAGGVLGDVVGRGLAGVVSFLGATLFLLALFLSGATLFTGISWLRVMDATGALTLRVAGWIREQVASIPDRIAARKARRQREQVRETAQKRQAKRSAPKIEAPPKPKAAKPSEREQKERQVPLFEPSADAALPSLSLLDAVTGPEHSISKEALEAMSRLVEMKLQDFGVEVEVVAVHPGPVITRFELQPAPGVKVSQISNLAKDLARSLVGHQRACG